MTVYTKREQDRWPSDPGPDDIINLLAGTHGPYKWGVPHLTIQGAPGVDPADVIVNGAEGNTDDSSLRGEDGCDGATLRRFRLGGDGSHGVRITECPGVVIEDVSGAGYEREMVLTADCLAGRYRRLKFGAGNTGDDHEHALYVSGKIDGTIVEDCEFRDRFGSAVQFNSFSMAEEKGRSPKEGRSWNVILRRVLLSNCGAGGGGTPLLSCMGIGFPDPATPGFALLAEDIIFDRAVNGIATFFGDEGGEEWNCNGIVFHRTTVQGNPGFGLHLEVGSTVRTWGEWKGWKPSQGGVLVKQFSDVPGPGPVPPSPAPTPHPTPAPPPAPKPPFPSDRAEASIRHALSLATDQDHVIDTVANPTRRRALHDLNAAIQGALKDALTPGR